MANDKAPPVNTVDHAQYSDTEERAEAVLPSGWKYKKFGFGSRKIWYASPEFQIILVALVCFLCPGQYYLALPTEPHTPLNETFRHV